MLKFFRRIRQNLLLENKIGKYLTYAIGEIVLVVIGILIALSINNANKLKEQRLIEQEYLGSLHAEFSYNLDRLNDCDIKSKQMITDVHQLLKLFDKTILDSTNNQTVSEMIHRVFRITVIYTSSNGVLTDLINSGNLNIIQNKDLRHRLSSFEASLKMVKDQEKGIIESKNILEAILCEQGSIRNIMLDRKIIYDYNSISESLDNKTIFESILFENRLLEYLMLNQYMNQEIYSTLETEVENILLGINNELNND